MKNRILSVLLLISFLFGGKGVVPISIAIVEIPDKPIHFHLGLGISAISTRSGSISMDIFHEVTNQDRLGNISFIGGYDLNEYLGVEARYIRALQDEHKVKMSGFSVLFKPQFRLPLRVKINIYGLLGIGQVSINGVNGNDVNFDKINFQFGGGVNYRIEKNIDLIFDYIDLASNRDGRYYNGASKINADIFTAGTIYRF